MKIKPKTPTSQTVTITRLAPKRKQSLITKILHIISEDIKSLFKADQKSKEDKMRYEAFMELCRK